MERSHEPLFFVFATLSALVCTRALAGEPVPDGRALYNDKCAMCHEVSGKGIPGTFPPLAGNPHVMVKDPSTIVREILDGMPQTDITVKGRNYGGGMPAWGNWLSDAEVAAIATYVRNAWGNHAPSVTEAQVARLRK